MTILTSRVVIWGVVTLVATLGIWGIYERLSATEARATLAEEQLEHARQREQQKELVISALWQNAATIESQRRESNARMNELTRLASNRLAAIKELQNENTDLRDWAATRLPDAVIRMHKHPAYTGADAYYQSMRDTEPMHTASVESEQ
ncbi:Rz-like lysis system protein LysB [Phytohalomonas tamaricis]|uniref:Rz-like lysis system protein LysB n=1 Tax=Phytohalomonas tamaricis TaxID=2081032 RepID=UPI000D0AC53C|nr:Rz-like lysis system protein LysB [Phytohalomonas tamaricis]